MCDIDYIGLMNMFCGLLSYEIKLIFVYIYNAVSNV